MNMDIPNQDLTEFIVIGDRVLIKPREAESKTSTGLYLPPGVHEREEVRSGYILKTGPGYPIPSPEEDEDWKPRNESVKYIPLQAREGDLAIYLKKHAYEIEFRQEKYVIVPQSAILLIIRDEGIFE